MPKRQLSNHETGDTDIAEADTSMPSQVERHIGEGLCEEDRLLQALVHRNEWECDWKTLHNHIKNKLHQV